MKTINKNQLLLAIVLFASTIVIAQTKKTVRNEKKVFDVSMTCENCKLKIEKNIAFEHGVLDMYVNLKKKTVSILYDTTKTSSSILIDSFKDLGYEATIDSKFNSCTCKIGTDCGIVKKSANKIPCSGNCNKTNETKYPGCC